MRDDASSDDASKLALLEYGVTISRYLLGIVRTVRSCSLGLPVFVRYWYSTIGTNLREAVAKVKVVCYDMMCDTSHVFKPSSGG